MGKANAKWNNNIQQQFKIYELSDHGFCHFRSCMLISGKRTLHVTFHLPNSSRRLERDQLFLKINGFWNKNNMISIIGFNDTTSSKAIPTDKANYSYELWQCCFTWMIKNTPPTRLNSSFKEARTVQNLQSSHPFPLLLKKNSPRHGDWKNESTNC